MAGVQGRGVPGGGPGAAPPAPSQRPYPTDLCAPPHSSQPPTPQRPPPPLHQRSLFQLRASEDGGSKGGVPLAGVQGRGVPGGGPGAAPPAPSQPFYPAHYSAPPHPRNGLNHRSGYHRRTAQGRCFNYAPARWAVPRGAIPPWRGSRGEESLAGARGSAPGAESATHPTELLRPTASPHPW